MLNNALSEPSFLCPASGGDRLGVGAAASDSMAREEHSAHRTTGEKPIGLSPPQRAMISSASRTMRISGEVATREIITRLAVRSCRTGWGKELPP